MKSVKDSYELSNGTGIPCVGYGTYRLNDGMQTAEGVLRALDAGYRHIDTASYYKNERSVGDAVRKSGLPRAEVFVTSKLWNDDQGYEKTMMAFDRTMNELGFDYLDLYLIHWPRVAAAPDEWPRLNRETWDAMTQLYEDGRIKAIGVSNFRPHHIDSLIEMSTFAPMVNQIELHPGLNQRETVKYCRENNIRVEAWGPFSRGRLFGNPTLTQIAAAHGKTEAQTTLRWMLQQGIIPLPKSVTPERIIENTQIFDFNLTDAEMKAIGNITGVKSSGQDPDKMAW